LAARNSKLRLIATQISEQRWPGDLSLKSTSGIHMTNRAAKSLSAVVISSLAAVSLAAGLSGAARAADDCLAAPKGQAPQGAHWYYRIDRTTKRHCWYVRDESKGSQQASASPAQPAASQTSATLQKSIADARAEFPAAAEHEERTPATPQPKIPDVTNSTNVAGDSKSSSPGGWILASRWSNNADADSNGAPMQTADAAAAKQRLPAAATRPPAESEATSVWALVAALAGALAAAGIASAVLVRHAGNRSIDREARHDPRQAIWSNEAGDETPVAPNGDEPVMNWVRIARETQETQNSGREVERLLARAPRRPLA
jgi:hypothetical protein